MNKTVKLCSLAVLTALSIIANFCTIPLPGNNAVSFTLAVCFFTGIYFGALPAAIVGYMGDLIAHLIHPLGDYNWFMAISITLYGVVCALVYKLKIHRTIKIVIAAIICYVVCLCGLNTFGLWLQYVAGVHPSPFGVWQLIAGQGHIGKSFWVYLAGRAPMSAVNLTVNAVIVAALQESKTIAKAVNNIKKKRAAPSGEHADEETPTATEQPNDNSAANAESPKN